MATSKVDPYTDGLCISAEHAKHNWWISEDPADVARAQAVCYTCPARVPCRQLGETELAGVWGGYAVDPNVRRRRLAGWRWRRVPTDMACTICGETIPRGRRARTNDSSVTAAACRECAL